MTNTVFSKALAAMFAAANFPPKLAAELAAAAKVRKAELPTVVRLAGILRRYEPKARGATIERVRSARRLAVNEAAALGYVA